METVSKDDTHLWKTTRCTEILKAFLVAYEFELREKWAEGVFTKEEPGGTIQLNSKALGELEAITRISHAIENMGELNEATSRGISGISPEG